MDLYALKMNAQPALNYNQFVEAKLNWAKDIYENGPKNNDPDSLLLAECYAELKQQELELKQQANYAKLVADDFNEDIQTSLNAINYAIQNGWIDNELWSTNRLFKTVIRKFNKVIAVNPVEPWIPIAKIILKKAQLYLTRDEEEHEFDQYPNLQILLEDFRKNYYEVTRIVGKFLYDHANGDPLYPSEQW